MASEQWEFLQWEEEMNNGLVFWQKQNKNNSVSLINSEM